jgi:hypothetical protein
MWLPRIRAWVWLEESSYDVQTMLAQSMITRYHAENANYDITMAVMADNRAGAPPPPPPPSTPSESIPEADKVLIGLVTLGVTMVAVIFGVALYLLFGRRARHTVQQQGLPPGSEIPDVSRSQSQHQRFPGMIVQYDGTGAWMPAGRSSTPMGGLFVNAGQHIATGIRVDRGSAANAMMQRGSSPQQRAFPPHLLFGSVDALVDGGRFVPGMAAADSRRRMMGTGHAYGVGGMPRDKMV